MNKCAIAIGLALFASQFAVAQIPPTQDYIRLGNFEWNSVTGKVEIQYARSREQLVVLLYMPGSLASKITADQFKVWVLTQDGSALARVSGQALEPVVGIMMAGGVQEHVTFTFKWTPSTGISAIALKAGDRDYLFPVTANPVASITAKDLFAPTPDQQTHITWIGQVFERMQTIKPGMTRRQLLEVFRTEGGLSTGLRRTYVSQDCPFFKVDVEFEAVGRPARDSNGRVTLMEADQDRIVRISTPYLAFGISD